MNSVRGFGSPLIFFTVAPEDKDAGKNRCEQESEPRAVWNLGES